MNIENFSNIEATILFKSSLNTEFNFSNHSDIQNVNQILSNRKNKITFDPDFQIIPPNQKAEVLITLDCLNEEKIFEILELMVQNGEAQFVNLRANI